MSFCDWNVINNAFISLCPMATIAMIIVCSYEYYLNKDLCVVTFKKFNTNKDDIYPSVSLCIYNPYQLQHFKAYGDDLDIDNYVKFLDGKHWDERMRHIDYNNITEPLIDNVMMIRAMFANRTWIEWELKKQWKSELNGMNGPYISFKTNFIKCVAVDIPYLNGKQIRKFEMKVSSKMFSNGRRPPKITTSYSKGKVSGGEGLEIVLHYTNQFLRGYSADMGKWNWPDRGEGTAKNYLMVFQVRTLEVFTRRNKPQNDQPCDTKWRYYDERAWESSIQQIGCRSPLWKSNLNIPLCTNKTEMTQVAPQSYENDNRYPICCRRIEKLQYDYSEEDIEDMGKNNNTELGWVKIRILYGDSMYKEITQVRAFNYQSLIGKI